MTIATCSPETLKGHMTRGDKFILLDVRTPAEFQEIHVQGAENLPLDRLDAKALIASRAELKERPVLVICRSGARSQKACEALVAAGLEGARTVEGGTLACAQAGIEVVRGQKTISLERQVRIAAGLLVLLGTAVGYFVHPAALGLAAFVGAGLTFAGITDTCGMAMLLAKMPWNQASGASCSAAPTAGAAKAGAGSGA